MTGDAEIDFETWMALSAQMLRLDPEARFDVLEQREIDPDDFARAEARWVMALSDDLSADRMDRVDRYAACCAAEMARRADGKPEASAMTAPALASEPAPGPVTPPPVAVPAIAAPAIPVRESASSPEPAKGIEPPPMASVPALVSMPAVVPPRAIEPPPIAAPPAVVPLPPVVRAPAHLSGTMPAHDLSAQRPPTPALPFGQAPSAAFVAAMSGPPTSAPAAPAPVGSTTLPLGVDLMSRVRKELPFVKVPNAASEPALPPVATAGPPVPPASPSWPRLTLDTYASLCAELSVFPERASEILQKYGVPDDAGRRGMDREWAERLSAHPEAQVAWQRKLDEFRAWLLRAGR